MLDKNNIVVDDKYMTNIPGLFAAGDCIGGLLQIAKAVSDGAHAALSLNKYVRALN
jgi:thioredoxin reductase (NADPH)